MKILKRLLPFAHPLNNIIPEYLIFTFFGIIFGLANFALLIPVLDLLFAAHQKLFIQPIPSFDWSLFSIKQIFLTTLNNIVVKHGQFKALLFVCGLIGVSITFSNFFKYLSVKVLIRLRLKVLNNIRNEIFRKYLSLDISFHNNYANGEALMVITSEVQEIESSIINSLQVLLRDPFIVIAYFCMLMYWSAPLTLFTLFFLPFTGYIISSLTKKLKKLSYFNQDTLSQMFSFTNESLNGIKQIQSFTAEKYIEQKFGSINDNFSKNSKKLFAKKELATPISEVLGIIAVLTLVLFGGYLIVNGKTSLTGNGFIAYLALYTQIIQPLKNLSQTSGNLQKGIVACEKIFKLIDEKPKIANMQNAIVKNDFLSDIKINNIEFSYGEQQVINQIELTVQKGQKIAIVGSSGCGKSTLVDLICRFYDVDNGSICIDGLDIKKIDLEQYRKLISLVNQNTFLFDDTIANNIAFGNTAVTKNDIVEAAKIANAHEFILSTEHGYETRIGENGVKLSGGQRQRITIARAILKNAPILILDEATSALDTESERLVQDAINNLMQNRTSIVIAHRLSTIRHADEIIVLHKGAIAERGSHDNLLTKNGIYKRLIELQEVH